MFLGSIPKVTQKLWNILYINLKFLLSNLESKVDKLEVNLNEGEFKLLSRGQALDLPFMTNNKSQDDLVTSIVSLCPKFITIYNGKILVKGVNL